MSYRGYDYRYRALKTASILAALWTFGNACWYHSVEGIAASAAFSVGVYGTFFTQTENSWMKLLFTLSSGAAAALMYRYMLGGHEMPVIFAMALVVACLVDLFASGHSREPADKGVAA